MKNPMDLCIGAAAAMPGANAFPEPAAAKPGKDADEAVLIQE